MRQENYPELLSLRNQTWKSQLRKWRSLLKVGSMNYYISIWLPFYSVCILSMQLILRLKDLIKCLIFTYLTFAVLFYSWAFYALNDVLFYCVLFLIFIAYKHKCYSCFVFVNVNLLIDNNVNQIMSIDLSYLKDICSLVLFPMTSPKRKAFFDRYLHKLVYLDLPYFRSCVPT